jgi:hypothetical protein
LPIAVFPAAGGLRLLHPTTLSPAVRAE